MDEVSQNYDPQVLTRISSLKITAMNLVDGILTGQHRSRHKGIKRGICRIQRLFAWR